jgi:ATP-dependent helicase/nuclease subunit A
VCQNEDVDFPPGDGAMPGIDLGWTALEAFWESLAPLVPDDPDPDARCTALAVAAEFGGHLAFARSFHRRPATLAAFMADWKRAGVTMKWWGATGRLARDRVERFQAEVAAPFLDAWRCYVYRLAVTVLAEARTFYAGERRRQNVVNYVDLLVVAARLLRENAIVRRALQQKYRWFFIDEFQDTDPLQAEIFLRLAADEASVAAGVDPAGASPIEALRLRPGALFVVGDPKQSIYRFRRADIDIYHRVRACIEASGGEVLRLTANWRSVRGICALANTVFASRFPAAPTRESPAFEPLDARRPEPAGPRQARVLRLVVPAEVVKADVPAWEAERIARVIASEVTSGRRTYGAFLVLTRTRPRLRHYAEAFERHHIPVEVSGAGRFGGSDQVAALAGLLAVLADPLDGPALVGVLRGPFFGVSDPELFAFARAGGRFDLTAPMSAGEAAGEAVDAGTDDSDEAEADRPRDDALPGGRVMEAIRQLQAWRRLARILPLGAAVERVLDESGWLALAATASGGARAGDLLQAVDYVRAIVEDGGGLADAADALAEDEEVSNEVETLPLEPGRRDVVRLMNLHKAKGLEAEVVFLADPASARPFDVELRVVRDGTRATGYLRIAREASFKAITIADPPDWDAHQREEQRYQDAEIDRLLYVAATRARDVLIVGHWAKTTAKGRSQNEAWEAFDGFLAGVPAIEVPAPAPASPAAVPDVTPAAREAARAARAARHAAGCAPSWHVRRATGVRVPVQTRAARVRAAMSAAESGGDGTRAGDVVGVEAAPFATEAAGEQADAGAAWGSLIHGLLEHAMRHREATRADLERLATWLTVETPDLRPAIPDALRTVGAVSGADFWRDARAAEHHVEVPFAVCAPDGAAAAPGAPDGRVVVRGVIDLVYRTADGWRVLDYKTDRHTGEAGDLVARHAAQLDEYRRAWSAAARVAAPRAGVCGVRAMRVEWE